MQGRQHITAYLARVVTTTGNNINYKLHYNPQQDSYQSLSSDFDYTYADSFTKYSNNNLMIDLRGRSRSDKNFDAPDLVVDNSAPFSYGEGSRKIRFK